MIAFYFFIVVYGLIHRYDPSGPHPQSPMPHVGYQSSSSTWSCVGPSLLDELLRPESPIPAPNLVPERARVRVHHRRSASNDALLGAPASADFTTHLNESKLYKIDKHIWSIEVGVQI